MPVRNFKFLEREEIDELDWRSMTDEQQTGYILEVDLEYPQHLHRDHSSFPLAPEQMRITGDMLSPYARGNN
jgi:hypothetical protein